MREAIPQSDNRTRRHRNSLRRMQRVLLEQTRAPMATGESMRTSADLKRCNEWSVNQCNLRLNHPEPHDFHSVRRPFNRDAGYIASLRSGTNKGWVVIYEAAAQGIDTFGAQYAVVCQTHNTIVG